MSERASPLRGCLSELELIERPVSAPVSRDGHEHSARRASPIRAPLFRAFFGAFGALSPFLPPFLAARGLAPEALGLVLGAGTAVRLVCGPFAGRLADLFQAFRAELAIFAVLAAGAALLYFPVTALWMVVAVSLFQAAALAPIVPLADALSLAHARARGTETSPAASSMDGCVARDRLHSSPVRWWPDRSPAPMVSLPSSG